MYSSPLLGLIPILSIVSALDPDPPWIFDWDLPSNTDLSSNSELLASTSPLDLDFGTDAPSPSPPADPYFNDMTPSNDLPWTTDLDSSSNMLELDNPFLVADCSSSSANFFSSVVGKSRLRRGVEDSSSCNNNDNPENLEGFGPNDAIVPSRETMRKMLTGLDQQENSVCLVYSQALLPVGVCSSGLFQDETITGGFKIGGFEFITLTLRGATLCTFILVLVLFLFLFLFFLLSSFFCKKKKQTISAFPYRLKNPEARLPSNLQLTTNTNSTPPPPSSSLGSGTWAFVIYSTLRNHMSRNRPSILLLSACHFFVYNNGT